MNSVSERPILEGQVQDELPHPLDSPVHVEAAVRALSRYILPFSRTRLYTGEVTLLEIRERLTDNPRDIRYKLFLEQYKEELEKFIS